MEAHGGGHSYECVHCHAKHDKEPYTGGHNEGCPLEAAMLKLRDTLAREAVVALVTAGSGR